MYSCSKLPEVIRSGVDPHSYTATMATGLKLDHLRQLSFKLQLSQQAKAADLRCLVDKVK